MFRKIASFSRIVLGRPYFRPIVTTAALCVIPLMAQAQEPRPPCLIDVPVYGPTGDNLEFKVTRVMPFNQKDRNLLAINTEGSKITASGSRISIPFADVLGREI